jgi:hypothetical protein
MSNIGGFDDFFGDDDFMIDPEDLEVERTDNESWNTGIEPDVFASGNNPDIFSTKG